MASSQVLEMAPLYSASAIDPIKVSDPPEAPATISSKNAVDPAPSRPKKDLAFWLVMLAVAAASFLGAIDLTSVSTALPTIVEELHGGDDFVWVGSAYSLASTAILPLSGNLANIFGRRVTMLSFMLLISLGSALSGAAFNMNMLIAGRTVQGLGGGGVLSLSEIVVTDLVPLRERGLFMGILAAVWAFASAIGPPIGGALAQGGAWRWLFYLNLPLSGVSVALVLFFMRLKRPEGSVGAKLKRVDWTGNALVIVATTIAIVALVQGGTRHSWNSYQILLPLCLGLASIADFLVYEARWVKEPTVPYDVLNNRTSLSGYAGTFMHGLLVGVVVYYLPVYFQGSMLASPIRSSVMLLPTAFTIAPFAIITGASVAILRHYVAQNVLAWILCTVGAGLLSLLTIDSSVRAWAGYQVMMGVGLGMLYSCTSFPVLAPLPVTKSAHALAFQVFIRIFAQTFGVTIGSTILQNELRRNLPSQFVALFPAGLDIAYAAIPQIPNLPMPLRDEVRTAFADSMSVVWKSLVGVAGLGFLSALFMKQVQLHDVTDEAWGMEERSADVERRR